MSKSLAYDLVLVFWWDAGSGHDIDDASNHHRKSVGFLIEQNEKGVFIAMEDDALSGVHFVPLGMIEEVKVLRRARRTKS